MLLTTTAVAGDINGWRNGGAGVVDGAQPPIFGGDEAKISWQRPTGTPGNASPVQFGELICITEEPVNLSCFDAATGEQRGEHPDMAALRR